MNLENITLAFATVREMKAALAGFGPQLKIGPGESAFTTLFGQKVQVLVTGISLVNAAFSLGGLIGSQKDVAGVVGLGVAGAFDLEVLPLGTAVLVCGEIWPEFGLMGPSGMDPKALGFSLDADSADPVWDRIAFDPDLAASNMGLDLDPSWPRHASLTVAGVTGTEERAKALFKHYGAHLENMEGFALALGCGRAGIPFLEVRTVSNLVGSRKPEHWDLKTALAGLKNVVQALFSSR